MKRFRDIQGNDAVVTALRQMVDEMAKSGTLPLT